MTTAVRTKADVRPSPLALHDVRAGYACFGAP
jgi:hypothetical protein